MKILILGVSGMIGNALYSHLNKNNKFEMTFLSRKSKNNKHLIDLNKPILFKKRIENFKPDVLINCLGVVKHNKPKISELYAVNSFLPNYLSHLSEILKFKLIHISTDCVFSGKKGNYNEQDLPDPIDYYGKSKLLGEIKDRNSLTLRCSVIGHSNNKSQLLEWFLSQEEKCVGYKNAIYTGLTVNYLAQIIEKILISHIKLNGIIHLSSKKISKFDLLKLIAKIYEKKIEIIPDEKIKIDRSLDSSLFKSLTKFEFKSWSEMIKEMKENRNA